MALSQCSILSKERRGGPRSMMYILIIIHQSPMIFVYFKPILILFRSKAFEFRFLRLVFHVWQVRFELADAGNWTKEFLWIHQFLVVFMSNTRYVSGLGVYVSRVEETGPSYIAGLRQGDLLLAANNRPVSQMSHTEIISVRINIFFPFQFGGKINPES